MQRTSEDARGYFQKEAKFSVFTVSRFLADIGTYVTLGDIFVGKKLYGPFMGLLGILNVQA